MIQISSVKENLGYTAVYTSSQAFERNDFYALFGAIFYIGIILSIVFIIAAAMHLAFAFPINVENVFSTL